MSSYEYFRLSGIENYRTLNPKSKMRRWRRVVSKEVWWSGKLNLIAAQKRRFTLRNSNLPVKKFCKIIMNAAVYFIWRNTTAPTINVWKSFETSFRTEHTFHFNVAFITYCDKFSRFCACCVLISFFFFFITFPNSFITSGSNFWFLNTLALLTRM